MQSSHLKLTEYKQLQDAESGGYDASLSHLRQEFIEVQRRVLQFEQEAIAKDREIATLSSELEQSTRKYQRLEEYLIERDKAYESLSQSQAVMKKENSKLNAEKSAIEADVDVLKSKVNRLSKENEDVVARLRICKKQNTELTNALAEKSQRLRESEAEVNRKSEELMSRVKVLESVHEQDQERIAKGEQLVRNLYNSLKQQVQRKGSESEVIKEYSQRMEESSEAYQRQQLVLEEKAKTIASLEGLLQEAVARIASATRDLSEAERKSDERTRECRNLEEALSSKEREMSQLREQRTELGKEIATLISVNNELVLRCNAAQEEIDTKAARVEEVERLHREDAERGKRLRESLEEDSKKKIAALTGELGAVQSQLASKSREVDDLADANRSMQVSVESLKSEIDLRAVRIAALEAEVAERRGSALITSERLKTCEIELRQRDELIEGLHGSVDRLQAAHLVTKAEVDQAKAALESTALALQQTREQLRHKEQSLASFRDNEETHLAQLKTAQNQLRDQLGLWETLKANISDLEDKNAQLEISLRRANERAGEREADVNILRSKLKALEEENSDLDVSISSIKSQRESDRGAISELQQEIERLCKQNNDGVSRLADAVKTKESMSRILELFLKFLYGRKREYLDVTNLSSEHVERITHDLEKFKENVQDLESTNHQLQRKIDGLNSTIERECSKAYEMEKRLDRVKDESSSILRALHVAEDSLRAANDEISALRNSTVSLLSEKELAGRNAEDARIEKGRLEAEVARLKLANDRVVEALKAKDFKLARRKAQISALNDHISELKKSLLDLAKTKELETQKLTRELDKSVHQCEVLKTEAETLQANQRLLASENELLGQRLQALHSSQLAARRLVDCQGELESSQRRLAALIADNEHLAEGAVKACEEIEGMKLQIAELESHKFVSLELTKENEQLRGHVTSLQTSQHTAAQDIIALERSLDSIRLKCASIESELSAERTKSALEKVGLESKIQAYLTDTEALQVQIKDLSTSLAVLKQENLSLVLRLQSMDQLRHELSTVSSRYESGLIEQERLQSSSVELSVENEKLRSKAVELDERLAITLSHLDETRGELELLRETVSVLQNERVALVNELEASRLSSLTTSEHIERLESSISQLQLNYHRATEDLANASETIAESRRELDLERASSSELREENRRLCRERDAALNSLYLANNEREGLQSALVAAQTVSYDHSAEREQALLSLHRMSVELADMREQLGDTKEALTSAQSDLNHYADAYRALREIFSDLAAVDRGSPLTSHDEVVDYIRQYKEDADSSLNDLKLLRSCIRILEAEKEANDAMVLSSKRESQRLKASVSFLEEVCEKSQAQRDVISVELKELQSAYNSLLRAYEERATELNVLEAQNRELIAFESIEKTRSNDLELQLKSVWSEMEESRKRQAHLEIEVESLNSEKRNELASHQR